MSGEARTDAAHLDAALVTSPQPIDCKGLDYAVQLQSARPRAAEAGRHIVRRL
jgi:hypothetical protein